MKTHSLLLTLALASSAHAADLTVDGQTVQLSGLETYDTVRVVNGGRIVVADWNGTSGGVLEIIADTILVDATSSIDADGAGFRGGVNDANGEGPGGGLGSPGNDGGGGGGHGGPGGQGLDDVGTACNRWEGTGGGTYDTDLPSTTVEMGSGGAAGDANGDGGDGGGAIKLVAKRIDMAGTLTANGDDGGAGGNDGGGAGSGGAIMLVADTLNCTGTVAASGGDGVIPTNGTDGGGGGGGGVIEQYFNTSGTRCAETVDAGVNRCGQARGAAAGVNTYQDPGPDFFDWDLDGYTTDDCDKADSSINPGATEVCDGVDNDCSGGADGADAADTNTYYTDSDMDGFGDPAKVVNACTPPSGAVSNSEDCNDNDIAVSPSATEVCGGGDEDCDDLIDDADDSVTGTTTFYADTDGDGSGDPASPVQACVRPEGTSANNLDCNDANGSINPDATEVCGGGDEDCDNEIDEAGATGETSWFRDSDSDGFGATSDEVKACAAPEGYEAAFGDCNDNDSGIFPGAPEVCDGVDQDCDQGIDEAANDVSQWFNDADGDGYGDPTTGEVSCGGAGLVNNDGDCDDDDAATRPGAPEQCNGRDDDCDGELDESVVEVSWFVDADQDGYGDPDIAAVLDCAAPEGRIDNDEDCDDGDAARKPGATEVCNEVDDNCDGAIDEDLDCDTDTGEPDTDPPDTSSPEDTGSFDLPDASDRLFPASDGEQAPTGCGCGTGAPRGGSMVLWLVAGLALRRRR